MTLGPGPSRLSIKVDTEELIWHPPVGRARRLEGLSHPEKSKD